MNKNKLINSIKIIQQDKTCFYKQCKNRIFKYRTCLNFDCSRNWKNKDIEDKFEQEEKNGKS